jgi:16S rRNA G966 N2-methylase RsmD
VIRIEGLTETQIRGYVIADNRLAEIAGWDEDILAKELQLLTLDIDFDVELSGFEMGEIDVLLGGGGDEQAPDAADEVPPIRHDEAAVSQPGDLWCLGPHRLLCGDARDPDAFLRLMQGRKAQMVFTDPPYNLPIAGFVGGKGKTKHGDFAMASGEMTPTEFAKFLIDTLGLHAQHSISGSIHFICMDWRHIGALLHAGEAVYSEVKNLCVWAKTNGGMGSLYRSQHELVFVFQSGSGPVINNVKLGAYGRNRSNVWSYAGQTSLTNSRQEELAMHPTVKPVRLVADAILDCSKRGGMILDGFAGSGTTIMAAEQTGRLAYALELDARYVDVIIRRWEKHTGEPAEHAVLGATIQELAQHRCVQASVGSQTGADTSLAPSADEPPHV